MDKVNSENSAGQEKLKLNLPECKLRLRSAPAGLYKTEGLQVYDCLRKKFVALTPEEYVRQNFVSYLLNYKGYPLSHVNNEIALELNGTQRRCDTLVFDDYGEPLAIVEYKAPYIKINQEAFEQIVRYNMVLRAPVLIVSNGMEHYCCLINIKEGTYSFVREVPDYSEISSL